MNKYILTSIVLLISVYGVAQDSLKVVTIKDVEVEGRNVIKSDDKAIYIPTQKQKNAANSGVGLLYNLMIPQLDVDRLNGGVKSIDNSKVAVYINGIPSKISDVQNIRPKDVLKVEFYNNAKDKFPNEDKVVNFIMREYKGGGYVDLRLEQRFFYEKGKYKAIANFDHKKLNYIVQFGAGLDRDRANGTESEEVYSLNPTFTKFSTPQDRYSKSQSYYGLFRVTKQSKNYKFLNELLLTQNRDSLSQHSSTSYSSQIYPSSNTFLGQLSKGISPSFHSYFYTKLDDKNTLEGELRFSYGRNTYNRNYVEGDAWTPIVNDIREDIYSGNGMLEYKWTINKNHSFNFPLYVFYTNSQADYGTSTDKQNLSTWDILPYPTYTYKIEEKLSLSLQAGWNITDYRINKTTKMTKVYPRPALTVNYNINNTSSAYFDVRYGNTTPEMSTMNNASQRVNNFEVKMGNQNLKSTKLCDVTTSYYLYKGNLTLATFFTYSGCYDLARQYYFTENDYLVNTYLSDGNYHQTTIGVSGNLALLNKSLYIKMGVGYSYQKLTGVNAASNRQWQYRLSTNYYIGEFSFMGYFTPAYKTFYPYVETRCDYGISGTWGHKGLFVEVGCNRLFDNNPYQKQYFDYQVYRYNKKDFSDSYGKQVYIKLSYNFDFGRKVNHEEIDVDLSNKSGMLDL